MNADQKRNARESDSFCFFEVMMQRRKDIVPGDAVLLKRE